MGATCQWCRRAEAHDDVRCLREERDALERYFREAVDALAPYLQSGGRFAHLMSPGESITKLGPARLVGVIDALVTALQELWAEVHADHGDINSPKWVRMEACEESACVRARAALALAEGAGSR